VSNVKSLALFLVLVAAPAFAPSLAAQDKEKLCNDLLQRPMRVGQWASYRWTGGRTDGAIMRMAVVGTEAVAGTPYYWFEVVFDDASKGTGGKTVVQMLIPGLGNQATDVRGMILKTGDEAAMRMPEEMVRMTRGQMGKNFATEFGRKCMEMDVVGWEQTTVAAGSFRAVHLKHAVDQTDAWVVPELYFGVLRAKLKDGSAMELTGRGADAKSSITETPQTMPFPH
jgi:hypothetical protein